LSRLCARLYIANYGHLCASALDGSYRGFEDFCVLNAKRTDQKYSGSYETSRLSG